jgi:hypothetical protein
MKRLFIIILVAYGIFSFLMIVFSKEQVNQIIILTQKQIYSRLITDNETLDINIFVSSNKSFILDKSLISYAKLKSENEELSVDIKKIELVDKDISYKQQNYYQYLIKIDFSDTLISNYTLNMFDCLLEITYQNNDSINLEIGDLSLDFQSITGSNHIDFTHLFGVTEIIEQKNYLMAIALKLDNLSNQNIFLKNIYTNTNHININTFDGVLLKEDEIRSQSFFVMFKDFDNIKNIYSDPKEILLNDDFYLVLPLEYSFNLKQINRFPIFIEYIYNNQEYCYVIDDYIFFSERIILNEDDERIREFIYQYQES